MRRTMPRRFVLFACLGLCLSGCRTDTAKAHLPAVETRGNGVEPPSSPARSAAPEAAPVLSGTLEPHRRSTLMPRVGGPVVKVHVREGDVVKRGALLVSIDPEQYVLGLRQAEVASSRAKVELAAAKREYERQKDLLARAAVPRSQFEAVETRYQGALVSMQAAEVTLAQARKAQRDASIRAPYTGAVTRKHVSEGDMASSMPPTALITMEETETLDLRVQVPAAYLDRAHAGDPILVRLASGKEFSPRISRVVPTINPGTRTFAVIVEIDNAQGNYRAGLFAEVRLTPPSAEARQ